ncbi:GlxA family transcriptional regulator [Thetidibacter halocola]|uniref:Helix-turn-helix domain-containing protein n=1 Tax=Thetidibacter halocola TaxID=2827239 RepID=A0A8J8B5I7_9RHOB|nr:helix-turn-helix domain-containing protein [Thetidibacter halocola]MBS0122986.1 helix-turn-helix domain-containing protein [Thetidibacter halocola]
MQIRFVLFPGFPLLPFALARETLDCVNRCAGRPILSLALHSPDGNPVMAQEGLGLTPDATDWPEAPGLDLILLFAPVGTMLTVPMGLRAALHRADRGGATLGGLAGGGLILARLGLLEGRSAVLPPCPDAAPLPGGIARAEARFALDRRRLTVVGGMATAEAILAWIARSVGGDLAAATARTLEAGTTVLPLTGGSVSDPILSRMRTIMAAHMQDPLPLEEVAEALDLSPKQLRLRCHKALGRTPIQAYSDLRLDHARALVAGTGLSVNDIAEATGFASASAFTRSFRARFGDTPRDMRAAQLGR